MDDLDRQIEKLHADEQRAIKARAEKLIAAHEFRESRAAADQKRDGYGGSTGSQ